MIQRIRTVEVQASLEFAVEKHVLLQIELATGDWNTGQEDLMTGASKAGSGHRRPDNWRGTVDFTASKAER